MGKVYVTRCAVKKDGKMYQKGSVIEGLTKDEINQGIEQHWLQEVGKKEDAAGDGDKDKEAKDKEAKEKEAKEKRKALVKEAKDLKVTVTDDMTDEAIQKLIEEAKNPKTKTLEEMNKDELKAKAKELGIDVGLLDSEEKLRQKIVEVQK
jgi:hypothetical protein